MHYDLGISTFRGQTVEHNQILASKASEYGYACIAFNKMIFGTIKKKDSFDKQKTKESQEKTDDDQGPTTGLQTINKAPKGSKRTRQSCFRQLSRVTVVVENAQEAEALTLEQGVLQSYDIVAARPLTAQAFTTVCQSPNVKVDLISLDFSERLGFFLHKREIDAAVGKGMYFEIEYSPAIRDATAKRHLVSNCVNLFQFLNGRHIVISSGAESPFDLRGPYDVMNLGQMLGLTPEAATKALTTNCENVLAHAEDRSIGFRGLTIWKSDSPLDLTLLLPQAENIERNNTRTPNPAKKRKYSAKNKASVQGNNLSQSDEGDDEKDQKDGFLKLSNTFEMEEG